MTRTYENQFALVPNNMASGRNKITSSIQRVLRLAKNGKAKYLFFQALIVCLMLTYSEISWSATDIQVDWGPIEFAPGYVPVTPVTPSSSVPNNNLGSQMPLTKPNPNQPPADISCEGASVAEDVTVSVSSIKTKFLESELPANDSVYMFRLSLSSAFTVNTKVHYSYYEYDDITREVVRKDESDSVCFPAGAIARTVVRLNTVGDADNRNINDSVDENDILVSFYVDSDDLYKIDSAKEVADSYLVDDDDDANGPIINLEIDKQRLLEGDDNLTYKVTSNQRILSQSGLDIEVEITKTNCQLDFEDYENLTYFRSFSKILRRKTNKKSNIEIIDDDNQFGSCYITVGLVDGSNYTLGETNRIDVTILDDDIPTVSLDTRVSGVSASTGVEGSKFTFNLTSTPALTGDVAVRLCAINAEIVAERNVKGVPPSAIVIGSDASCTGSPKLVRFSSETTKSLVVETVDRNTDDPNGSIILTVVGNGNNYNLGSEIEKTVEITDNEANVEFTFLVTKYITETGQTDREPIEIGNQFWFKVMPNNPTTKSVRVIVRQERGRYLDLDIFSGYFPDETELTFPHTFSGLDNEMWMVDLMTKNDPNTTANGVVTAELVQNSGEYSISGANPSGMMILANSGTGGASGASGQSENPTVAYGSIGIPPEISISAVTESIVEGKNAVFQIDSNRAAETSLSITAAVNNNNGNFLENAPLYVEIELKPSNTVTTFKVKTHNDTEDEPDGSVEATVLPGLGYRVDSAQRSASVIVVDNDDAFEQLITQANSKIIPEVVMQMASGAQGAMDARMELAFNDSNRNTFEIDGNSSLNDVISSSGEALNDQNWTFNTILGNSSFEVALFPEEGVANTVSLWGLGDNRDVTREIDQDAFSWNGEVFSGHFGLDARISPESIAGLSTSFTESQVEFTGETSKSHEGVHEVRMTAVNPYYGWVSTDGKSSMDVFATYGLGEVRVEMGGYSPETAESSLGMSSIGGGRQLYSSKELIGGGSSEVHLKGDVLFASHFVHDNSSRIKDTLTQVHQVRVSLVGSHAHKFITGSTLDPTLSVGIRQDGGNVESWTGLEFGVGIGYNDNLGLSVSSKGGMMIANELGIREWSIAGALEYDRLLDDLGLQLNLTPTFGKMQSSNFNSLWDADYSNHWSEDNQVLETVLDAEIGYGLNLMDGRSILTHYGGVDLSGTDSIELRMGSRVKADQSVSLGIEGTQSTEAGRDTNRGIELNGSLKW